MHTLLSHSPIRKEIEPWFWDMIDTLPRTIFTNLSLIWQILSFIYSDNFIVIFFILSLLEACVTSYSLSFSVFHYSHPYPLRRSASDRGPSMIMWFTRSSILMIPPLLPPFILLCIVTALQWIDDNYTILFITSQNLMDYFGTFVPSKIFTSLIQ